MEKESAKKTNPAHRLHEFLKEARRHGSAPGIAAILAWAGDEVPKKGHGDVARAFRLWVHLLEMAKVAEMADYSSNPLIGSECFHGIGRILVAMRNFNIHRPTDEFLRSINDGDLSLLAIAGTLLDQAGYEKALDDEELDDFEADLESIRNELESSEAIPEAAKITGKRITEILLDAFKDYSVTGADGIGEALAMAYGLWLLNHTAMGSLKDQPVDSPIMKLWKKVQEVTKAYSTIKAGVEVGKLAADFIESLSPPV